MGWLPSAPQLQKNLWEIAREASKLGIEPRDYVVQQLKSGKLRMSREDPDHPDNFPRNLFVWRSNLLGSSGKGHEYFLKHLLGTTNGVQGDETVAGTEEVVAHAKGPEGKLDLLVTLDFRMSTTCLYSDIVLPTATWYEKNDLNTSDMHLFIHPLSQAVDPVAGEERLGDPRRASPGSSPRSRRIISAWRRTWCRPCSCTTRRASSASPSK